MNLIEIYNNHMNIIKQELWNYSCRGHCLSDHIGASNAQVNILCDNNSCLFCNEYILNHYSPDILLKTIESKGIIISGKYLK